MGFLTLYLLFPHFWSLKGLMRFSGSGNKERLVSLIDTIGFDDPDNDTDSKIIAELVDKLINNCNKIHLFVIAVNGQSPRMDGSLVAMLKIFKVYEKIRFSAQK